jgi:3-hydroxyisobutyrate dehydrogenase-like beta-hydroxyacid dehydrogenase
MGRAISEMLLKAGHELTVYNRTRSKAESLIPLGARIADGARDAILASEATLLVLIHGDAVQEVLRDPEVRSALAGRSVVNVSATKPREIQAIATQVQEAGGRLCEMTICTPADYVRGGRSQALIAGDSSEVALWSGVCNAFCTKVFNVGALGNASESETAGLIGCLFTILGSAYTLRVLQLRNVPLDGIGAIWSGSPGNVSDLGTYILGRVTQKRYENASWSNQSNLATCDILIEYLRELGLPVGPLAASREIFAQAVQDGFGDKDIASLVEVLKPGAS